MIVPPFDAHNGETPDATDAEPELRIARRDPELRARFTRLGALNAAWAVLANFELSSEARHLSDAGRALSAELVRISAQPLELRDHARLPKLDGMLDTIEHEIRTLAFEVPVAQLRATLPARLASDRRGLLDLLDLMLVAEIDGHEGFGGRISALDYLITLLCSGGQGSERATLQDPVGLTPRLYALCERAGENDGPEFDEAEAEFHAAARVDEQASRDEQELLELRRRKRELGEAFFVPRVLRAIVSYNAALSWCIERGVHDSRDWGWLAAADNGRGAEAALFETDVLPRLAEALGRRSADAAPSSSAVDRVAWCLDLASLDEPARTALFSPGVGRRENVEGTAILIGLLCRSAVILEAEFPAIGIAPDRLAEEWVRELDTALKRKVNERIAGDSYEEACAVSELRNTFLYSLITDVHRERRDSPPRIEAPRFQQVEQEAQQLAGEAVEQADPRTARARNPSVRSWLIGSPRQLPIVAGAAVVVLLAVAFVATPFFSGDLDRMSGAELERISPHLTAGTRNGEGGGSGFVGTLGAAWEQLPSVKQELAADQLVRALQAQGVREVMVYDESRVLRIQALGERSVRVRPARSE